MSEIRIMDPAAGDIKMEWNPNNDAEVAVAKEAFEKAKKKGMFLYKMKKDGTAGELLKEFDSMAERIIGMPKVVGG